MISDLSGNWALFKVISEDNMMISCYHRRRTILGDEIIPGKNVEQSLRQDVI